MIDNDASRLQFGIMCSGTIFQKWQAQAITSLLEHEHINCKLIIFHKKGESKRVEPLKNRLWLTYFNSIRNRSKALEPVDLSSTLAEADELDCQIIKKGKFSEYFEESDITSIKDYQLDFILKFSRGIVRGEVLNAAKYGVWSFHHDDEMKYRGRPACFWEIYNNDPVTGAMLQRITDRLDGGTVLKKGLFDTQLSYIDNRDQVYLGSAPWPKQVCIDILNQTADYFQADVSKTNAPIYYLPTNREFIQFLIKTSIRKLGM